MIKHNPEEYFEQENIAEALPKICEFDKGNFLGTAEGEKRQARVEGRITKEHWQLNKK